MLGLLVLTAQLRSVPHAAAAPLQLPLDDLGQSTSLALTADSTSDLTLPVPEGLKADRLTGTIQVSGAGDDTALEVFAGDRQLAKIALTGEAGESLPLSVGLPTAASDGSVDLSFRLDQKSGVCGTGENSATQIVGMALKYQGTPKVPTGINEFLPSVLTGLTIVIPDKPSAAVGSAAVRLASAIAARYSPATPTIRLKSATEHLAAATGLGRRVTFTGSGAAGLTLGPGGTQLTIGGDGDALTAQVAALTSDLATLASGTSATADGRTTIPQDPPETQTLTQLGIGGLATDGGGSATVHLGIESAQVAGVAGGWRLHLVGTAVTNSQRSPQGRQGSLVLYADGTPLQTWPLTSNDFDLTTQVPATRIGRFTDLSLVALSDGAGCNTGLQTTLAIDPASTLTTSSSTRGTSTFTRLPAALQPRYVLGSPSDDASAVADSVTVAVALQRLSPGTALTPQWQPGLEQALQSRLPAVLLVGDQPLPDVPGLPLRFSRTSITVPDGRRLQTTVDAAALQLTTSNSRTVLVEQASSEAGERGLITWLQRPDSLAGLTGVGAVRSADGTVKTFGAVSDPGVAESTRTDSTSVGIPTTWVAAIGGAVGGAVIVGAALLIILRVRRRGGPSAKTSRDGRTR
ncbi:hypothetical protein GCM10011575_34090 [Microlunatus endophyticus]|uniref:Cellulose synthase subunit n=1 Tax=Microlunatus endophyticus TaxID=1716077 RepID=A0A917SEP1_9ACTN|nr:hypothetical protein [Microlunatus endophyticus]GGL72970.1 hypothetical protein GCM10011575_34090 [Microlunatus endophyticus]